MTISPFAPACFPSLPPIDGFEIATAKAGVKYENRVDLWVLRAVPGTQVAGVFTKNLCPGAPVEWSRTALKQHGGTSPRVIVVNSGNANVFGGQKSSDAVIETATSAANIFGGRAEAVFLASTGVIGEPLDASKITRQFPEMKTALTPDGWEAAARAIMTTDTYPKGSAQRAEIDGVIVQLNGIVKGSGMIAPDMATMLGYIATDAHIAAPVLQSLLSDLTETSFNAITVDSDSSTSDTVMLLASCQASHRPITDKKDPRLAGFRTALDHVMRDLALQVVKDGEGASKFVTINVSGAVTDISAKRIGLSVANSPLVKTAIAGEDANWGRIVMAVGKAGEPAQRDRLTISLGPHLIAKHGQSLESYAEKDGASYMKNPEIDIHIDLGIGSGRATVWTCDFTHGYIDINADYRS